MITSSLIISAITLIIGIILKAPLIWLPISVLITSIVDSLTRSWTTSDRLGRARTASTIIKGLFSLMGIYATIGQLACVGLIIFWILK